MESVESWKMAKRFHTIFHSSALVRFAASIGLLTLVFAKPLTQWIEYAVSSELDSYCLLIPILSLYLIRVKADVVPQCVRGSRVGAAICGALMISIIGATRIAPHAISEHDFITANIVSYAFGVVGCCLWAFGVAWINAKLLALGVLFLMAPLPSGAVHVLEEISRSASAAVAEQFFAWSGVPALREGDVFQLSNISIRVAQECSGIHSRLVLWIASIVAADLMLRGLGRKLALVAFAIALGVVRNGFRIWVLGWLCVHRGAEVLDSSLHHQGGPIFFALSLVPLFIFLMFLRRREGTYISLREGGNAPGLQPGSGGSQLTCRVEVEKI